jgi:hypothetical protein
VSSREEDLAELYELSTRAMLKGWRRFDQVWGPAISPSARVNGMCLHRIRSTDQDSTIGSHGSCDSYRTVR